MNFTPASTAALAALGSAVGAIAANSPRSRGQFFSKERFIGSLLGLSAGLAVGTVAQTVQRGGLAGLDLVDSPAAPLKNQPFVIVRTDAPAPAPEQAYAPVLPNRAARPLLADRLLLTA